MTKALDERSSAFIRWIDRIAKPLVIISVVMYLVEEEMSLRNHWDNSFESPHVFLWSERAIATIFSLEVLARWWRAREHSDVPWRERYPFNVWGFIDILSVAPFWVGFFCSTTALGIIRTFRILRLLKFFRYSRSLQLTALKFYRAFHNIKGITFSYGLIWLFFAVICLKLEQPYQPEEFHSLLDAAWFTIVTATTVGYGDMSPVGPWGKVFVGLTLIPIISSAGMAFAAFTNACESVQELEDDPDVDPIAEWKLERERVRQRKLAEQNYTIEE